MPPADDGVIVGDDLLGMHPGQDDRVSRHAFGEFRGRIDGDVVSGRELIDLLRVVVDKERDVVVQFELRHQGRAAAGGSVAGYRRAR